MIADRLRLKANKITQITGGPTIVLFGDGEGTSVNVVLPKGKTDELDDIRKGDVVYVTVERQIKP